MEMNVGCIERFFRIFIGVILFALTLYGSIGAWGYIGIMGIATGLSGMCPPYYLFGINTNRCAEKASH